MGLIYRDIQQETIKRDNSFNIKTESDMSMISNILSLEVLDNWIKIKYLYNHNDRQSLCDIYCYSLFALNVNTQLKENSPANFQNGRFTFDSMIWDEQKDLLNRRRSITFLVTGTWLRNSIQPAKDEFEVEHFYCFVCGKKYLASLYKSSYIRTTIEVLMIVVEERIVGW